MHVINTVAKTLINKYISIINYDTGDIHLITKAPHKNKLQLGLQLIQSQSSWLAELRMLLLLSVGASVNGKIIIINVRDKLWTLTIHYVPGSITICPLWSNTIPSSITSMKNTYIYIYKQVGDNEEINEINCRLMVVKKQFVLIDLPVSLSNYQVTASVNFTRLPTLPAVTVWLIEHLQHRGRTQTQRSTNQRSLRAIASQLIGWSPCLSRVTIRRHFRIADFNRFFKKFDPVECEIKGSFSDFEDSNHLTAEVQ